LPFGYKIAACHIIFKQADDLTGKCMIGTNRHTYDSLGKYFSIDRQIPRYDRQTTGKRFENGDPKPFFSAGKDEHPAPAQHIDRCRCLKEAKQANVLREVGSHDLFL